MLKYPLHPQQFGLWYIQQTHPECHAYNLVFSCKVNGIPSSDWSSQLEDILNDLLKRFPILSTQIEAPRNDDALPYLVNNKLCKPHYEIANLQSLSEAEKDAWLKARVRTPIDLACAPLWRIYIAQIAPNEWIWIGLVHHVLLDFWSVGLLLQYIEAYLKGKDVDLVCPNGISYLTAEITKSSPEAKNYWLDQLTGLAERPHFYSDFIRPAKYQYQGESFPFMLSPILTTQIKEFSKTHGLTPYMVLLAGYFAFLYKYSRQTDLIIATPVTGRTERDQQKILGQYVNTLPIRCKIIPEKNFFDLLQQVKKQIINGLRYQTYPFHQMVADLGITQNPVHTPLTSVGFSWEKLPLLTNYSDFFIVNPLHHSVSALTIGSMKISPYPLSQQLGQLDIQIEMGGEQSGNFIGLFKYNTSIFKECSAQNLCNGYIDLLERLLQQSDCPLQKHSGPSCYEQKKLLSLGTGSQQAIPDSTVTEFVLMQTQADHAIALSDQLGELSYGELRHAVSEATKRLKKIKVYPGHHIGLLLSRDRYFLIYQLALLRLKTTYIPLDSIIPTERLNEIANDAQLDLLITDSAHELLLNKHSIGFEGPIFLVDIPDFEENRFNTSLVAPLPPKQSCAYLIYTSGSTGKPKGVRITQAAIINLLLSMQETLKLEPGVKLLAITTFTFDIAVLELLLSLRLGGTLYIAERELSVDANLLTAYIEQQKINIMQATPATWRMLASTGWQGQKKFTALCGGETLDRSLANYLLQSCTTVWNVYGPTETTIWSSISQVKPNKSIVLGQPLANTQLYILDADHRLVPPGVIGELWIGGSGLALDYWLRPTLNTKKFIEVELPQTNLGKTYSAYQRVYATGDLACWNAEGQLIHLGRTDFQVKIRGYRIELEEIENRLRTCSGNSNAVIALKRDPQGEPRLVGYLIAEETRTSLVANTEQPNTHSQSMSASTSTQQIIISNIQQELAKTLPTYMLPEKFVWLNSLPKTANNKINRQLLPDPIWTSATSSSCPPRDNIEIQLATLFSELLSLTNISVDTDFFTEGGHSLLAVQLSTKIQSTFGVQIPISTFAAQHTLEQIASYIRQQQSHSPNPTGNVIPLRIAQGTQTTLWLFHPIGGTIFCYLPLIERLPSNLNIYAFPAPGLQDINHIEVSIEKMAEQYIEMIRLKQENGPYLLGGWCFGGILAYEIAKQLEAQGQHIAHIYMFDTRAPILDNHPEDADDATLLSWFARDISAPLGKQLGISIEKLRSLKNEEMLEHVYERALQEAVLPPDSKPDAIQQAFEVYLANGIALQLYLPSRYDLPVSLFRAMDELQDYGPQLGWEQLIKEGLSLHPIPGDHTSIMYPPAIDRLAVILKIQLSKHIEILNHTKTITNEMNSL